MCSVFSVMLSVLPYCSSIVIDFLFSVRTCSGVCFGFLFAVCTPSAISVFYTAGQKCLKVFPAFSSSCNLEKGLLTSAQERYKCFCCLLLLGQHLHSSNCWNPYAEEPSDFPQSNWKALLYILHWLRHLRVLHHFQGKLKCLASN